MDNLNDNQEVLKNENIFDSIGDSIYDDMELLDVSLDGKNEKESSDFELLENDSNVGSSYPLYPFEFTNNSELVIHDQVSEEQNELIIEQLQLLNDNISKLDSGLKIVTVVLLFFLFLYTFRWVHLRLRR